MLPVSENVVVDDTVTLIDVVFGVLEEDRLAPLRRTPSTVNPFAFDAVTLPLANPKSEKFAPFGSEPFRGNDGTDPPFGGVKPLGGRPLKAPRPLPNPPARLQLPVDETGMIVTVLAATEVDPPGFPTALTQSPTATCDSETDTVWVKVVEGVQLTVTWPLCGFCTSMEVPLSAATVPDAAGSEGRVEGDLLDALLALADAFEVVFVVEDPQAAAASATTPRIGTTYRALTFLEREKRSRGLDCGRSMRATPRCRAGLEELRSTGSERRIRRASGSLVSQCVDRCESGRAVCGINAETYSDRNGDGDCPDGGRR